MLIFSYSQNDGENLSPSALTRACMGISLLGIPVQPIPVSLGPKIARGVGVRVVIGVEPWQVTRHVDLDAQWP